MNQMMVKKVCQHIVGPEKIHLDQTQDAKQVILKSISIRTDVWCKSRCLHDLFFCRAIKGYTSKLWEIKAYGAVHKHRRFGVHYSFLKH